MRPTLLRYLSVASLACLVTGLSASPDDWRLPESVAVSPDGDTVLLGCRYGTAERRSPDGKNLGAWTATVSRGGFLGLFAEQITVPVTGVAYGADGTAWYTADDGARGRLFRDDGDSVVVGDGPQAPLPSADGRWVWLCCRYSGTAVKVDADAMEVVAAVHAGREPQAIALGAEERLLFVASHLPDAAIDPALPVAADVAVLDARTLDRVRTLELPDGSTSVRGMASSPDGAYIYLTHTVARYRLPTTQVERGWMNSAALSVLDGRDGTYINTVMLDDIDGGAANPWGVAVSPDGRTLAVAHAGTQEVSLIDRAALHARLDAAAADRPVSAVTDCAADVINDFSFLSGIRRRVKLGQPGPRGIALTNETLYVALCFADGFAAVPVNPDIPAKVMPMDGKAFADLAESPVLRGEMLFNDATKCFQNWQSCASCHPDARADALNWDLMNDGIGNPKQTKSLLYSYCTPPTMITGIRRGMMHCNRAGFRYIQFVRVDEEDVRDVDAYLIALLPRPSPYTSDPEAIARGREVYRRADCARCHMPEYYYTAAANPDSPDGVPLYDIGLGTGPETGRKFDVATLCEVWRTGPYLYDGRAKTMREVLTRFNTGDLHGVTTDLTRQELSDLEAFILSL